MSRKPDPAECFKHDCHSAIATWELEVDAPSRDAFPNGLCLGHAQDPKHLGTIDKPTHVR